VVLCSHKIVQIILVEAVDTVDVAVEAIVAGAKGKIVLRAGKALLGNRIRRREQKAETDLINRAHGTEAVGGGSLPSIKF
jgi:hypothetical protein